MKTIRIIPRLDIKGPNLVKGIHLEGLRVLGQPEDYARFYYENGADELIYQDVVASLYDRNSLNSLISRTAKFSFIPLTVGGGIRTISDIKAILRSGADKVCINTAAVRNPVFIKEASKVFGSSTIVISIEAIKQTDGRYLAYTDNGRCYTGIEVISWAKKIEKLGAGEILLTSVDREGTGLGFDTELIKSISDVISIPLVVHGGASNVADIYSILKSGKVDGVALSSILHYSLIENNSFKIREQNEGNMDFLKSGKSFNKIKPTTINNIKSYLNTNHINIRL